MATYYNEWDNWVEQGREVLKADLHNIDYPALFRRKFYTHSGEADSAEFDRFAEEVYEWLMTHERDDFVALIPKPKKEPRIKLRVATPAEVIANSVDSVLNRVVKGTGGNVQKRAKPQPAKKAGKSDATPATAETSGAASAATAKVATSAQTNPSASAINSRLYRRAHPTGENIVVRILVIITGILSLALWVVMYIGSFDFYEPLALFVVPAFAVLSMLAVLFSRGPS